MLAWRKLNKRWSVCLVLALTCSISYAQKKDPQEVYKKIKRFAYKRKFTTLVYNSVFVDPQPNEYPSAPATKNEGKVVNPYLKYSGKTIRKIKIVVYDPFGYSVNDTLPRPINTMQKISNRAHVTTRHWVIDNKLLFKRNDTINALSLSESERLLRQSVYINDARIYISPLNDGDSVDVNVIVQDKWAITMPAEATDIGANARFRNYNLFGSGQQFEQFARFTRPNSLDFSGSYTFSNIDHSYISSQLYYVNNKDLTLTGVSFDRPFFSPLAQWAGGLSVSESFGTFYYKDALTLQEKRTELDNLYYDTWIGKSIKVSDKRTFFDQSTNIIVGERFYGNTFQHRPSFAIDPLRLNLNNQTVVGNVGFAVQQFYKDKYIYRFGANEDVPEGLIMQVIYGATQKEFAPLKYYLGGELARSKHYDFGYLSTTFSYGMFFNRYMPNDITNNLRLYYFSDLFRIGRWYLREFVNYNLVYGINKAANEKTTLTADDLYGFNSGTLAGNTKSVLDIETVAYAPYNLVGFKFAPVLLAGFGMIDNQQQNLLKSNLYQGYSLGLMVRNENLLSSTFQVSFGLYPFQPGGGNYVLKYNPVTSFTLRVRAFSVSKPSFIGF